MSKINFLKAEFDLEKTIGKDGSGLYMKLEIGENKFRVLSADKMIEGYEFFTKDHKPIRCPHAQGKFSEEAMKKLEADCFEDNEDKVKKQKYFIMMPVYNYKTKSFNILELNQKSILTSLSNYIKDPDYGSDLAKYDIKINRTGKGLETQYSLICGVPKPFDLKIEIPKYDLNKIFLGENPLL